MAATSASFAGFPLLVSEGNVWKISNNDDRGNAGPTSVLQGSLKTRTERG